MGGARAVEQRAVAAAVVLLLVAGGVAFGTSPQTARALSDPVAAHPSVSPGPTAAPELHPEVTRAVVPVPGSYQVKFNSSTKFSNGTSWTVTIGGTTYTSTGSDITVGNVTAGDYNVTVDTVLSPDTLTQYTPTSPTFSISVSGNTSPVVTFRVSYWVSIWAAGPGEVVPGTGWYPAGSVVELTAAARSGYVFAGWSGSGTGAYNGTDTTLSVTIGGPVQEIAIFAPEPPVARTMSGTPTFWSSPTIVAALAVAALISGLGVGVLVCRRPPERRPPSSSIATFAFAIRDELPASERK
jgi:uncharacterized repeat protein (TIGR02543 family)